MGFLTNILSYDRKGLDLIEIRGTKYLTKRDLEPDVIVVLSFGTSNCNKNLSECIISARKHFRKDILVIIQSDIAKPEGGKAKEPNVHSVGELTSKNDALYISEVTTRDILVLAEEIIKEKHKNPKKVLFIGHQAHMQRILDIARGLGLYGAPFMEEKIIWGDSDENQLWVRSPWLWFPRELLTRIHHKLNGYY